MVPKEDFAGLVAALESAGLTRSEICAMAGISKNTLWRIATGEAREPAYSTIVRLKSVKTPVRLLERKTR